MPLDNTSTPNNADIIEILTRARRLIRKKRHWTQGTGHRIAWLVINQYCAIGAISNITNSRIFLQTKALSALNTIAIKRGFVSTAEMNDNSTHAQVLGAFDEAIINLRW